MKPPGLTIGQLAAHARVTVRAIRHYHRRGLLVLLSSQAGSSSPAWRRIGALGRDQLQAQGRLEPAWLRPDA